MTKRDSLGLVATQAHQIPDERTVGHPMKDDILQMPRDAFPPHQEISDNDAENRENAGAEIRGCCLLDIQSERTARRPHRRAAGRGLHECIEDVDHKPIERQKIPAIWIGGLLRVGKDELDETLCAMGNDI